jgi:hypothetical protein
MSPNGNLVTMIWRKNSNSLQFFVQDKCEVINVITLLNWLASSEIMAASSVAKVKSASLLMLPKTPEVVAAKLTDFRTFLAIFTFFRSWKTLESVLEQIVKK